MNELSYRIIGACIEVHKILGPGLLESIYEECLCRELLLAGLQYERQKDGINRIVNQFQDFSAPPRLCGGTSLNQGSAL